MIKNKLDWAMCIECSHECEVDECNVDYDYDEFRGLEIPYYICPECDGGIELTNKEYGDCI